MKKITKITPNLIGKKVKVLFLDRSIGPESGEIKEAMVVGVVGTVGLFGLAQDIVSASNPQVEQRHDYKYVFTFQNDSLGKTLELYLIENDYIPFL